MIVLILLAFAGMLAGIFLLLGMTPFEFAEDLTKSFASREVPISKRIGQLNHPKEAKGIQKTVREAKENWVTAALDDSVSDEIIKMLIDVSYELTVAKIKHK